MEMAGLCCSIFRYAVIILSRVRIEAYGCGNLEMIKGKPAVVTLYALLTRNVSKRLGTPSMHRHHSVQAGSSLDSLKLDSDLQAARSISAPLR